MATALITPPASLPVTLAKVKEFLKVENNDDDTLLDDLIKQAVSHIENLAQRKLISQEWRVYFDELPQNGILELPLSPVIAQAIVRYFDETGNEQILPATDFEIDPHSCPARVYVKSALCLGRELNGLEVDVQVGFGSSGNEVPGDIIRAIMLTIAHWYEFRGAVHPADQPLSNPAGLQNLLAPYAKVKM